MLTVAETRAVLPATIERGGACVMLTDIIGVPADGSAFEPVSAQPVMPSKQPRPATRGRYARIRFQENRSLWSG